METMYNPIAFSPVTTLTASLSPSDTIISVANIDAFPPAPNYATIGVDSDAETIRYAAKTGNQLSGCTRGVEGTAKSWDAGEYISRNFTAKDHQAMIDNINELDAEVEQAYSPTNKPTATDVGALPISGGVLTGRLTVNANTAESIHLKRTISGTEYTITIGNTTTNGHAGNVITHQSGGTVNSGLRIDDDGAGVFYKPSASENYVPLFGEHNKPSGKYVGNGLSTTRTINVGGIGGTLFLTSEKGCAYVSAHGAFCWGGTVSSGTPYYYSGYDINLRSGVLTIATTLSYFNENGVTYSFELL